MANVPHLGISMCTPSATELDIHDRRVHPAYNLLMRFAWSDHWVMVPSCVGEIDKDTEFLGVFKRELLTGCGFIHVISRIPSELIPVAGVLLKPKTSQPPWDYSVIPKHHRSKTTAKRTQNDTSNQEGS